MRLAQAAIPEIFHLPGLPYASRGERPERHHSTSWCAWQQHPEAKACCAADVAPDEDAPPHRSQVPLSTALRAVIRSVPHDLAEQNAPNCGISPRRDVVWSWYRDPYEPNQANQTLATAMASTGGTGRSARKWAVPPEFKLRP
jgi:hypothetical protein